ncbi:MAG TPA: hypothetical protein GX506_03290 [Firmicutes bacterium]|nr:hypothetical protein [Bacillota bacterium]
MSICATVEVSHTHIHAISSAEIEYEQRFKRLHAEMQKTWGRMSLVDQNGPEVLPSAQVIYCRYCERARESCCKADCEVFRDLVFGWEIGISPELNRIIPERERKDYFDLLLDPCENCPKRRSHIDPKTWRRVPPSCSGTRSRRFQEVLDGK